jgi:hypothetical protein
MPVYYLRVEIEVCNAREDFERMILRVCGLTPKGV